MSLKADTLQGLYLRARNALRSAGVATPDLDARLLVADAAGVDAQDIVLKGDMAVMGGAEASTARYLKQRLDGMPVGRILGRREFWGMELALSPGTLEPRPDTECLVEAVLGQIDRDRRLRIADIGTGSGAIALALAAELPEAELVAVDISEDALVTAAANARSMGLAGRIGFIKGQSCTALAPGFDWVVSNPPYIPTRDLVGLSPEVLDHDPKAALDGGLDGLDSIREIVVQAQKILHANGGIALEFGFDQASDVGGILSEAGFLDIEIVKDLAGHDRGAIGCLAG